MTKTTPRDKPATAIERDKNSLQRQQGRPSTPQGKWAKGYPTATTPTDKMDKPRRFNPYLLQQGEQDRDRIMHPDQLVMIIYEYMTIIESQNGTCNVTWHKWLK